MRKKALVLAMFSALLAFGLTACGQSKAGSSDSAASSASSTASQTTQKEELKPLVLEETGYTVLDQGYVMYGFKLTNPNSSYGALHPKVQITGKSADGKIVFTDTQTLMDIYPGESIYYGTQAGNGKAPDVVEFTASVDNNNWRETTSKREDLYTIENLSDNGSQYGMHSFTGEITLNADVKGATKPAITLLLRDEGGNIIYGFTTYQMSDLAVGVATPFEVTTYGAPDSYASFEVHATPWM